MNPIKKLKNRLNRKKIEVSDMTIVGGIMIILTIGMAIGIWMKLNGG